jgi:hypothetical protein
MCPLNARNCIIPERPAGWQAGIHVGYIFKSKVTEE